MQILVATDFSVRSDRALRRASLLARKLGARLTLLHVVDVDQPQSLIAADRTAATALLDDLAQTLRDAEEVEADWLVKVDDVYAGILAAADERSADLSVTTPGLGHTSLVRANECPFQGLRQMSPATANGA